MITEVAQANGNTICIFPDDSYCTRRSFYGKDADVTANADGTYTIKVNGILRDAFIFYTKDTKRVFMYDEDIEAWWEQ